MLGEDTGGKLGNGANDCQMADSAALLADHKMLVGRVAIVGRGRADHDNRADH